VILTTSEWQARSAAHRARVEQYTQPRRERRSRGAVHPVYDFLFQYYSYSAAKLETWHPAPHEQLVDSPQARACFGGAAYEVHDSVIRRNISALTTAERDTVVIERDALASKLVQTVAEAENAIVQKVEEGKRLAMIEAAQVEAEVRR
jgi:hypothetical protein